MFNPSTDFVDMTDGTEAVTLLRRGTDSDDAGTLVAHALRCAITTSEAVCTNQSGIKKQMPSDGQYLADDIVWHLPVVELPDAPQLGDVILDSAGQRWTILKVKEATFGTRWRCNARNLIIAHHLDDTIIVLKAIYTKSSCGVAEPTWQIWKTGIRARIQPGEVKVQITDQSRQTVQQYNIFIAEDIAIDQTHRILGPNGTAYRVTTSVGIEHIGELQVIEAEVIR